MLNRDENKHYHPNLKLHSDGIELGSSILWLDSLSCAKISFISKPIQKTKLLCPKIITTEETAKALQLSPKNSQHLICPLNQPFSLGSLRLELLPSGYLIGSCSILIDTGKLKILYAPNMQTQKLNKTRGLQIKQTDILITNSIYANQPSNFSRKNEKAKIINYLLKKIKTNHFPIVFCRDIPTAPELCQLLLENDINISVHKKIHEINKLYKTSSQTHKNYSIIDSTKNQKQSIIILPSNTKLHKEIPNCIGRDEIYIHSHLENLNFFPKETNFILPSTCDIADLNLLIKESNATTVYTFGPWAQKITKKINLPSVLISVLHPENQKPFL